MLQNFTPITVEQGEVKVYSGYVMGYHDDYFGNILMNLSWWKHPFISAFCGKLYHNPAIIAWVGNDGCSFDKNYKKLSELWDEYSDHPLCKMKEVSDEEDSALPIKNISIPLEGKVLVNHTKMVYIDFSTYLKHYEYIDDALNPIPLLTAVGNGEGGENYTAGGDYMSQINIEHVGSWALDAISVEDSAPEGFEILDIYFKN